jgi:hypothetical protein
MKKKILLGLAVIFVAMQAFRPARNLSATPSFTGKDDITVLYPPPTAVKQTLAVACYDCHSNQTRYPWYVNIQPVGWFLANHINEARRNLNFAEFGAYPLKRQLKKFEAMSDEVHDRAMPLKSYTLIHGDARLTDAQAAAFCAWADKMAEQLGDC